MTVFNGTNESDRFCSNGTSDIINLFGGSDSSGDLIGFSVSNDVIYAGSGADNLVYVSGFDVYLGQSGKDNFHFVPDSSTSNVSNVTFDGGGNRDTLWLSASDLAPGEAEYLVEHPDQDVAVSMADGGVLNLRDFEQIFVDFS